MIALPLALLLAPTDDEAAIERLIRGAYASYVGADATPRPDIPLSPRLKAAEAECTALQGRIDARDGAGSTIGACSDDYDVLCQCQDPFGTAYPQSRITFTRPDPAHIVATVTFPPGYEAPARNGPDLEWRLVKGARGWQVDDFWEYAQVRSGANGSYRARLTASIQAMRRKMRLPHWTPPAR